MKQKRLFIQIVGPYRSDSPSGIHKNIQRAREVAEIIWQRGHYVFCPHLNTAFMDGLADDEQFLELGLLMIEKVDAICVVDGWLTSEGSMDEVNKAEELGKPVYDLLEVPVYVE